MAYGKGDSYHDHTQLMLLMLHRCHMSYRLHAAAGQTRMIMKPLRYIGLGTPKRKHDSLLGIPRDKHLYRADPSKL